MLHYRLPRAVTLPALVMTILGASLSPVAAQEAGAETGTVTFRMTLSGPVDERDGFFVIVGCEDEWCADETVDPLPDGKIVMFCGLDVADAPVCDAGTDEFTIELQTGPMEYWFYRIRDLPGDSENQLLHHGTGQIVAASQTVTVEYVYPGAGGATGGAGTPTLPDTAVPAP
jgi:hypothetical protein